MDNTILRSSIDFDVIRQDVYHYFLDQGLFTIDFPIDEHTASTIIDHVQRSFELTDEQQETMWEIITRHELIGMEGAGLERGALSVLDHLYQLQYPLVILTNNAQSAAIAALEQTGIDHYFDHIVGREQMRFLKPSPTGVHYILNLYPEIPRDDWLLVGDAWVDGAAAREAGVSFVSYQANSELMNAKGVFPVREINHLNELLKFV